MVKQLSVNEVEGDFFFFEQHATAAGSGTCFPTPQLEYALLMLPHICVGII